MFQRLQGHMWSLEMFCSIIVSHLEDVMSTRARGWRPVCMLRGKIELLGLTCSALSGRAVFITAEQLTYSHS